MNSAIKVMAALLIVQLVLWLFLQSSNAGSVEEPRALLDASLLEGSGLNLEIDDAEGNTATLKKLDDGWQLASGLPADAAKADELLAKLAGLTLGWPASTNADAHQRFEVAENNFQRKLQLTSAERESTLYFGTSPGYQQVHARGEGDSVFAVKVANHEMPALTDDWLDKSVLKAVGDVSSMSWDGTLSVSKGPTGWVLGEEIANIEATQGAVDNVAKLQVLGVLDDAPSAPPAEAQEILVRDDNGEYRLSFWERAPSNDHVVVSSRYPGEAFRMANYVAEQLVPEPDDLAAPVLSGGLAPTLGPELLPTEGEVDLEPVL